MGQPQDVQYTLGLKGQAASQKRRQKGCESWGSADSWTEELNSCVVCTRPMQDGASRQSVHGAGQACETQPLLSLGVVGS